MKLCAFFAASALLLPSIGFAQTPSAAAPETTSAQASQLQLNQPTEIPGQQLSRGSYNIRVADRLQDRIIVQIQKSGSKQSISLLGYPNPGLRGGSFTGPVTFVSGLKSKPTLRGYAFAGGPVVEFIYPKTDAVTLAKANSVRVMAVDTSSEGRVSLPNLTQTDMSEVTLWMLTPTAVDPATAQPGIQAAKYQAPAPTQPAPAVQAQTSVSQPIAPASAAYSAPARSTAAQPAYTAQAQPTPTSHHFTARPKAAATAPVEVASNTHAPRLRPDVKRLPHTAGYQPLLLLAGLLSFALAAGLGVAQQLKGAQAGVEA